MRKVKILLTLTTMAVFAGGAFVFVTNVVEAHTRTVKIRVDKNGFSPASIDVEPDHKLNLVFNRANDDNCGSVVVFPKLNIRKSLPVGKDVIVSMIPGASGNISFACGTGIYKGSIVVSED